MSERKPPPSHLPAPPPTNEPSILEPAVDLEARQIHRRHVAGFLAGLSVAMPLAAGFAWLSPRRRAACPSPNAQPAPQPAPAPPKPAAPAIAAAFRPRLFIVLPVATEQHYDLGHALGEYLNHGSDEALAPLAAVDLACISASEIDLPATAIGEGPLALLLVAGDTQRLVRFALPESQPFDWDDEARNERVIDERIAIVSSAVRRAVMDQNQVLGVSPRMLAHPRVQEIATRARAGHAIRDWRDPGAHWLSQEEEEAAAARREPLARALTPDEAAHFAPALLAMATSVEGEARKSLTSVLAAVTRRRVVEGDVAGAEWATNGGCATVFEDRETNIGVACGMGHVPARSRRFLHFYTLKPSGW